MKKNLNLPDVEAVSARVHESWMDNKRANGITSRLSEDNEELMVPYDQLSEKAKDADRTTVNTVYKAIEELTPEEKTQQEVGAHSTL